VKVPRGGTRPSKDGRKRWQAARTHAALARHFMAARKPCRSAGGQVGGFLLEERLSGQDARAPGEAGMKAPRGGTRPSEDGRRRWQAARTHAALARHFMAARKPCRSAGGQVGGFLLEGRLSGQDARAPGEAGMKAPRGGTRPSEDGRRCWQAARTHAALARHFMAARKPCRSAGGRVGGFLLEGRLSGQDARAPGEAGMKVPRGGTRPSEDGRRRWQAAAHACSASTTFHGRTKILSVSGWAGGRLSA